MDCPDACSIVVSRKPDGTLEILGNRVHPFTKGFVCGKIKKHPQRLNSSQRITCPLIRKSNGWENISWSDALDLCAEKINRYRKEPGSILHVPGGGAKGVLKQVGKIFFGMLGASRLKGSLCDAAGIVAYLKDFGSRENHDPEDLLNSHRIVLWGKDLSRSSVHLANLVQEARKNGATILSISPDNTLNSEFSDIRIRIRPGTDRFLAAAAIYRLIQERNYDDNIILASKNWDSFESLIRHQSVSDLLKFCEADEHHVESLFQFYAANKPCATIIGAGLQRYEYGGENVRFINALAMVSGNIGIRGGGSYFHLDSLKNFNSNPTGTLVPLPRRTLKMHMIGKEIVSADPPIKMIWVNGSNIVNQAPDIYSTLNAFKQIEFKVVVDAFMTDTARMADLFLPCTLMLEQEDIIGSYLHDFIHYVSCVAESPEGTKNDFEIFTELGKRLNPPIEIPDKDTCLQNALNSEFIDIPLDSLKSRMFFRALRPLIPYQELKFDHQDQKYRFPGSIHPEPDPPGEYPLRLLSLVRKNAIHSQIDPEKQKIPPELWVAPETLKELDMKPETIACLVSPKGNMDVILKEKEGLCPGTVVYRRGDWFCCGGGINRVIDTVATDMGSGAAYYSQYVRIERK